MRGLGTLGEQLQHVELKKDKQSLIVAAASRGMKMPKEKKSKKTQTPPRKRNKKNERETTAKPKEKGTEMPETQQQQQQPQNPNARTRGYSEADLESLKGLGDQLGAIFGSAQSEPKNIRWKKVGEDALAFGAKAAIVTVSAGCLMAIANKLGKDTPTETPTTTD